MGRDNPGPRGNLAPSGEAAMLNAALESMPYGFSIWDADHRLLLWNQRYLDIYDLPGACFYKGMPLVEVCHLTIAAGNHPDASAETLHALYASRLDDTAAATTNTIYEKSINGRTIKANYLRSPALGWVITHEDITRQRQRETDLREQNLRFDAALESMPYGFCIWSPDLTLKTWNGEIARIYGLAPNALRPGASLADFFYASIEAGNHAGRTAGELHEFYRARISNLASAATSVAEEVLANGRTIKISFRRSADCGWVSTHEDVTDERDRLTTLQQREADLALQNMRFEAAVNNISQGLCMFDDEQKLVICNKRYADIYGLPPELVQPGTSLQDILKNRIARGVHPAATAQAYVDRRLEIVADAKYTVDTVELRDGRVISILHHPMRDGGWVSTHQDITEQRRADERIRHLARHDGLTDLPNRMYFREQVDASAARIKRGETVALLFVDLDHFKAVNDMHGHGVGDAVLKAVSDRLRATCRETDLVARLGGDEFAILHGPLNEATSASVLADRVVRAMSDPFDIENHHVLIGASVGIAVGPADGHDVETLMKNADLAVYRAKAEGRGAYHFFEKGMDEALQARLVLETGMRRGLAEGQFTLVFQPLFSLIENRVCGFEALLRWSHPERGLVMPEEAIPIAEETGLIVALGEWVLREACLVAAAWPESVRVAVNLSPVQFRGPNLTQHVIAALAAANLVPDRLELEVTESVLLAENESTLKTLHQIRRLGVRISMDDFGTGYSSLSYLRSFPFDKIKIDQSFVHDLSSRADNLAIIAAVIGLARSLGMTTTVEGIETEDQLELVREQGCTEVQGFLLSPPLSADGATTLVRRPAVDALPRFAWKTAS